MLSSMYAIAFALLLFTSLLLMTTESRDLKIYRGANGDLIDETQFPTPSPAFNFDEEEVKIKADESDAYDEWVKPLPKHDVIQNGIMKGQAKVPIVTRQQPLWSTPPPVTHLGDAYRTWFTYKQTLRTPRPPTSRTTTQETTDSSAVGTTITAADDDTITTVIKAIETDSTTPTPTLTPSITLSSILFVDDNGESTIASTAASAEVQDPFSSSINDILNGDDDNSSIRRSQPSIVAEKKKPIKASPEMHTGPNPKFITSPEQLELLMKNNNKKLLLVMPTQRIEQSVRSNSFTLNPPPHSWSSSWSLSPNGTLTVKNWDSEKGETVETVTAAAASSASAALASKSRGGVQLKVAPKPAAIQISEDQPHKGPTFNCRVLNAEKDGQPSTLTDLSCRLSFNPNDSCKCTYVVNGRDESGCATGFLYTCHRREPLAQS